MNEDFVAVCWEPYLARALIFRTTHVLPEIPDVEGVVEVVVFADASWKVRFVVRGRDLAMVQGREATVEGAKRAALRNYVVLTGKNPSEGAER